MCAATAERFADRPAIIDGDVRLTHAELFNAARRFGAGLVDAGVRPGDRVAIWTFNSAQWVIAALGLWQCGATLVPINTRFKGLEASDILRRSRARVLVTATDFLGTDYVAMLAGSGVELPNLETIVVASGPAREGTTSWSDFLARANAETACRGRPAARGGQLRRPVRHPLHLRHHRRSQGRRDDPRPHAVRGHRLGRDDRHHRRRPLPDGQPVLPHVRPEGRHSRLHRQRCRDAARAGVRRRRGAGPRRRREGDGAARPADAVPVDPRPSRARHASTCRACGSP